MFPWIKESRNIARTERLQTSPLSLQLKFPMHDSSASKFSSSSFNLSVISSFYWSSVITIKIPYARCINIYVFKFLIQPVSDFIIFFDYQKDQYCSFDVVKLSKKFSTSVPYGLHFMRFELILSMTDGKISFSM